MEKRLVSLFLILVFLIGNVSAAIPPNKQSLAIYNYKINEVQCSGNSLEVLVESLASVNLNLLFKATNNTTESIFSDQELKSFETSWFLITTTKPCDKLQKLEVNGYSISEDNKNIIYLNSESPYFFDGTETQISQPATAEIQPSVQAAASSTSNIYFGSKLIETINSNDGIKYYHQDHLGSTRLITDPSGNLVSRLDYDPFGRDLSFSNARYKFTGKEKDSSSLYYFGARYYDPSIGRFTQIDPSFEPSESPYSYVENNPLNKVDPNGAASTYADSTQTEIKGRLANFLIKNPIGQFIAGAAVAYALGYWAVRSRFIESRGKPESKSIPKSLTNWIGLANEAKPQAFWLSRDKTGLMSFEEMTKESYDLNYALSHKILSYMANIKTGEVYFFRDFHSKVAEYLISKGANFYDLTSGTVNILKTLKAAEIQDVIPSRIIVAGRTTLESGPRLWRHAYAGAKLAKQSLKDMGVEGIDDVPIGVVGSLNGREVRDVINNERVINRNDQKVDLPLPPN